MYSLLAGAGFTIKNASLVPYFSMTAKFTWNNCFFLIPEVCDTMEIYKKLQKAPFYEI